MKGRRLRPHRSCLKKTGPGDVSLIRIALRMVTVRVAIAKTEATIMSMILFSIISTSLVGVVLNDNSGNPSNRRSSIRENE